MKKKILIFSLIAILCIVAVIATTGILKNQKYKQAVQMADHDAFTNAIEQFSKLGDYRDSSQYLDYCLLRQSINESDWKTASKYATKIPDFLDASSYAQLCFGHEQYEGGLYEESITTLRGISSLAEAAELCAEVQQLYAEQSIASVQTKIDADDWDNALLAAEASLEYCDDDRLVSMKESCRLMISQREYASAIGAIRRGDFSTAVELLDGIEEYEDSSALLNHLNSGEDGCAYASALLCESNDPHILAEAFNKAGSYADASELSQKYHAAAQEQDYITAQQLIDNEQWTDALKTLHTLPGYMDSELLVVICEQGIIQDQYEEALLLIEKEDYEQAEDILNAIGEYSDAPVLLRVCQARLKQQTYDAAVTAYELGDYHIAYEQFLKLENYMDSAVYCRWIESHNEGSAYE